MKLFTSKDCQPCKVLKQWLTDNNINQIIECDIADNMVEVRALGLRSVPTLVTGHGIHTGDAIKPFLEEYHGIK